MLDAGRRCAESVGPTQHNPIAPPIPQLLTTTCTASLPGLSTAVDNCQNLVDIVVDVAGGAKTAPTTCDPACAASLSAVSMGS